MMDLLKFFLVLAGIGVLGLACSFLSDFLRGFLKFIIVGLCVIIDFFIGD